jgi:hypothetical protein
VTETTAIRGATTAVTARTDDLVVDSAEEQDATCVRRRTVDHGNTQRKSVKKPRTITRAALMTVLKDDLMTALKNALSSIPVNVKERIRIQRILIRSLKPLL